MPDTNVVPITGLTPNLTEQAVEVLQFLNAKTHKSFRPKTPNGLPTSSLEFVLCRLREGYTVQDCRSVIAMKCREWVGNDEMKCYLRPATLFNRTRFEQYLGQLEASENE